MHFIDLRGVDLEDVIMPVDGSSGEQIEAVRRSRSCEATGRDAKINMEHSYKGHRETSAKIVEGRLFWRLAVSGDDAGSKTFTFFLLRILTNRMS